MSDKQRSISKLTIPVIISVVIGLTVGVVASNYFRSAENPAANSNDSKQMSNQAAEKEVLYWVAPMDPNYRRDEPGKSPMGMDLIPVYAKDAGAGNAVHVNSAVQQSLGVRTSKAERRSLFRKIEATGYVALDETRVSQINLRTEGWIERLLVKNEGERISKGQLLLEFYSPILVNSQKEYIQAKRRDDKQMLAAAAKKLLALGMVQSDIDRLDKTSQVSNTIQVLAPQDGIITNLNVREGEFVKPDTEIMMLADLSSVWLRAEVFESQADWVAVSQSAEARLNYIPGEVFSGRVDYVYPILDPKTRTLQVRLRFDNAQERLKPNMYARVTIFGKAHPGALSIPREALIRGQENDRVVVALGDGNFTVHEVVSGIESGNWVEIVAGLEEGEEVVTSAQFLIDSEASIAGSIQRLDSRSLENSNDPMAPAYASGVVEGLDRQSRRIRISHGPIEQLGWAAMTMEFDVLPGSNLEAIQIGQSIQFKLTQSDVGDYIIQIIQKSASHELEQTSENGASSESPNAIDHAAMDHSEMESTELEGAEVDHAAMDHSEMNHAGMNHDVQANQPESSS